MRRLSAVLISLVLAGVAAPALSGASSGGRVPSAPVTAGPKTSSRFLAPHSRFLIRKIVHHRRATWRWQDVMGKPHTKGARRVRASRAKAYRKWMLHLWKRRHHAARRRAMNPPHRSAWLCIHRYEGSWSDGSAPYYGGLQMDVGFMSRYGSRLLRQKGPASNWTPLEQMWVAERALHAGRGFFPWPNAARLCGLI